MLVLGLFCFAFTKTVFHMSARHKRKKLHFSTAALRVYRYHGHRRSTFAQATASISISRYTLLYCLSPVLCAHAVPDVGYSVFITGTFRGIRLPPKNGGQIVCCKSFFSTGLRPDPLGENMRSPDLLASMGAYFRGQK